MTAVPPYVEDLFSATNRLREGNVFEARSILDSVEENRPAIVESDAAAAVGIGTEHGEADVK